MSAKWKPAQPWEPADIPIPRNRVVDAHSRWQLMAVICTRSAGCTKAPLLPAPCGMTINLMCVISTIRGCRPLLEKEIKKIYNEQLLREGQEEDGNFCQSTA